MFSVYELIRYIDSILVAVSLMMTSILKLRLINLLGAICFTAYGLLIRAYPVAAVNFLISLINVYYLYEIYTATEYFRLLEVQPSSAYLNHFLRFYRKDIQRFLPGFTYQPAEPQLTLFILRNVVPAGLFIAEVLGADSLLVRLDFVIPGYRDFKIGKYLFSKKVGYFKDKRIRHIYSEPGNKDHVAYLQRVGFSAVSGTHGDLYHLNIE